MSKASEWAKRRRVALALNSNEPAPLVFRALRGGQYARVMDISSAKRGGRRRVGLVTWHGVLSERDAQRLARWILDMFAPEGSARGTHDASP